MKVLLKQVKKEAGEGGENKKEISAAVCLPDGDKSEGVLLLDRKMKPKKLSKQLIRDAKEMGLAIDLKSIRFGRASLSDQDDTILLIRVNKEPSGAALHQAIKKRVKPGGFSDVVFTVDEALNAEPEEDGPTDAAQPAGVAAEPPPPPPPPPSPQARAQQQAPADWSGLHATLAALVERIKPVAGNNPMLLQPLAKLAGHASDLVKAEADYATASEQVEALRRALTTAAEQAKLSQQAKAGGGAVTYAKSRLAWLATRKKIEGDIDRLREEIIEVYDDEGRGEELGSKFRDWVAPVLNALDERLADALDDATNAHDEEDRAKKVAEAKEIIGDYTTFLNTDPHVKELDSNPFVPLSIRDTIAATLTTLAQAVR